MSKQLVEFKSVNTADDIEILEILGKSTKDVFIKVEATGDILFNGVNLSKQYNISEDKVIKDIIKEDDKLVISFTDDSENKIINLKTHIDKIDKGYELQNIIASNHINLKQEQEANGGGVINLPNNAMRSVAPNYRFNGLTLTNLVQNGDFRDGTEGWSGPVTPQDGGLLVTSEDEKDVIYFIYKNNYEGSYHKFYVVSELDVLEDEVEARISMNGFLYRTFNHKKGYYKHTAYGSRDDESWTLVSFRADKGSYIIKNLMVFDLTKMYGKGNEPTKEWCDEHIQGYFEGTKSVQTPMRVKSDIGKHNLLNPDVLIPFGKSTVEKLPNNNISVTTEAVLEGYNNWGCGFPVQHPVNIKKGNKITFSAEVKVEKWKSTPITLYFNNQRDSIFRMSTDNINISEVNKGKWIKVYSTYEAPRDINDIDHLFFYTDKAPIGNKVNIRSPKLEISPEVTPWTPYYKLPSETASNLYINNQLELKSVGTAKDYIEDGKLYKNVEILENVNEWTVDSNLTLDKLDNDDGNSVYRFRFVNNSIKDLYNDRSNKNIRLEGFTGNHLYNNSSPIEHYYLDYIYLWMFVDVKKIDPLGEGYEAIKKWVANTPMNLYVSLINEKVINLDTSGQIINHPNGTIFIEPIIKLNTTYEEGIYREYDNCPILEIEYISKNGEQLDISKAKIIDETYVTHPELKNGDSVIMEYRYDLNSIYGDNSIKFSSPFNSEVSTQLTNEDLNELKNIDQFYCLDSKELKNVPEGVDQFNLSVLHNKDKQITQLLTDTLTADRYIRFNKEDKWSDWFKETGEVIADKLNNASLTLTGAIEGEASFDGNNFKVDTRSTKLVSRYEIVRGDDLNNLTKTGMYGSDGQVSIKNKPSDEVNYFTLNVINRQNQEESTACSQLLINTENNEVWSRTKHNNGWSKWNCDSINITNLTTSLNDNTSKYNDLEKRVKELEEAAEWKEEK